jgi:hypothetical protein
VNSQAEYDALEPGTPYVDSKGNRGVKKGAKPAAPISATSANTDVVLPAAGT